MVTPIDIRQPYLGLNHVINTVGLFPSRSLGDGEAEALGGGDGFIAAVSLFGGNFAPRTTALTEGQLLPIAQNQALFSLIGTFYGGDGRSTFALPDLRDSVAVGMGTGPGLPPATIGNRFGDLDGQVTLTSQNVPVAEGGGGQPFGTTGNSLPLTYYIAVQGTFPSRSLGDGTGVEAEAGSANPMIGEVGLFAGNFAPRGYLEAAGQLLPISQYTALFSILGTTFGGDGRTTFALPDLRGRVAIGAGQGPGLPDYRLGQIVGDNQDTIQASNLPDGGSQPIDIMQPSLALNYIVALQGTYPSRSLGDGGAEAIAGIDPVLGEISMFAGNFAPRGFAFAHGQLLPISQYSALFSIYGTIYGGDGRTTFALPDLRGRVPVQPGNDIRLGETGGSTSLSLALSNLPDMAPLIDLDADGAGSDYATEIVLGVTDAVAVVDTDVTINDLNNDDIGSLTVTATVLGYDGLARLFVEGTLPSGITVDPGSSDRNLILTGAASAADYQAAAKLIRYTTTADGGTLNTNGDETITVTVTDVGGLSSNSTATVSFVVPVDAVSVLRDVAGSTNIITTHNTIADAVAASTGGDTVYVEAAAYELANMTPETVSIGTAGLAVHVPLLDPTLTPTFTLQSGVGDFGLSGDGEAVVQTSDTGATVTGNAGANHFISGIGADSLIGGLGDDVFDAVGMGDSISEQAGEGTDEVRTELPVYNIDINVENLTFTDNGNHIARGNKESNIIIGGDGNDFFVYDQDTRNPDTVIGGTGFDTFDARLASTVVVLRLDTGTHGGVLKQDSFQGVERFFGGAFDDTMKAGTDGVRFAGFGGNDRLIGSISNDNLLGGADDDTIFGFAGTDHINGGTGNDVMTGGADADDFVFTDAAFGADEITDFEDGVDELYFFSAVATADTDFTISGNGSAQVTVTSLADAANSLTINGFGGSAITIDAADFVFY